ncbi:MAG: Fe2+-dependent dioxygenase [Burkholderiales bacterium]
MLLHIPEVLSRGALNEARRITVGAAWADGRITAGTQSEQAKNNLQIPIDAPASREAGAIVLEALGKTALFFTAALPRQIFPPQFNCYRGDTNVFDNHVDNAVRTHASIGRHVRTDLSATLFLSEPTEYDGGELIIEDTFGTQSVKLPAGGLILYPASSVHRVAPVSRGARVASFFWIESMVRDDGERRLLFDLDMSILGLRGSVGDTPEVVRLTGCYHNLLRRWASV